MRYVIANAKVVTPETLFWGGVKWGDVVQSKQYEGHNGERDVMRALTLSTSRQS